MKTTFTLLSLLLTGMLSAQDWRPFYPGDTAHVNLDTSAIVAQTIWVDSAGLVGGDSVWYFNRVWEGNQVFPIMSDTIRTIGLGYLQERLHRIDAGTYHLEGTRELVIRGNTPLGQSWTFDTLNSVQATVASYDESLVFGLLDSVKTIALSTGDTFALSKHYGLLSFPDFTGTAPRLTLSGLQNRDLGESLPGLKEFFSFQPGEVFYFRGEKSALQIVDSTWLRREILTREEKGDSLIFTVLEKRCTKAWGATFCYQAEDTLVYVDSATHPLNRFPGQMANLMRGADSPNAPYGSPVHHRPQKKSFQEAYAQLNATIFALDYYFLLFKHDFTVGLGETAYQVYYFEAGESQFMVGYIRGQDSVGEIIPEEDFIDAIDPSFPEGSLSFYPNPTADLVKVEVRDAALLPLDLKVYDLMGREVWAQELSRNFSTVSLAHLRAGTYILEIRDERYAMREKLLLR
ncbi:MAG: T9SS type A sorting domain-containing protein [Bacteroidota bacterium]